METKNIDTSYTSFSFCLDDLSKRLSHMTKILEQHHMHLSANTTVEASHVFDVVDHMSCLLRDLDSCHVNYTKRQSAMINVVDGKLLLDSFRKSHAKLMHALDDFYVEKLHAPVWVCRHTMQNEKPFWTLSNLSNELSVLVMMVDKANSVIAASPKFAIEA